MSCAVPPERRLNELLSHPFHTPRLQTPQRDCRPALLYLSASFRRLPRQTTQLLKPLVRSGWRPIRATESYKTAQMVVFWLWVLIYAH